MFDNDNKIIEEMNKHDELSVAEAKVKIEDMIRETISQIRASNEAKDARIKELESRVIELKQGYKSIQDDLIKIVIQDKEA